VLALSLLATGASLGCGSGSSQVSLPPVSAAGVNHISGFTPSGPVAAGKPVKLSFTIVQPNGQPLTQYATGPGPHTGVHLIFVRKDLADIVHLHPPIGPDGKISETVMFPAPGPWMLLTDVYQKQSGTSIPLNYQLKQDLQVKGRYVPKPLGPVRTSVNTDGYTFTIHHLPKLKVANADYLNVSVTDPGGKPARPRRVLPPGQPRLLPYPHLQPESAVVRRKQRHRRVIHEARAAQDRDGVPAARQVASLPAGPDR
jgi:hypothetical protein